MTRMRVLHVVESFGGGVASTLYQYARGTPDFSHHLLRGGRSEQSGVFKDGGETAVFESDAELPAGHISAIRAIRQAVADVKPDVIHAHSSFAGLYVRLSCRASTRRPIVYTPHGYASERKDIPRSVALIYRLVEWALQGNTTSYAACSPREAQLSRFFRGSKKVHYVPNVVDLEGLAISRKPTVLRGKFVVAVAGRVTPARDPLFVAAVAQRLRSYRSDILVRWVGGGSQSEQAALNDSGVEVTGWQRRSEALSQLSTADLHFHPAIWDGFPMVLLEANALRVPSIVRDIPAFAGVPESVKVRDVEGTTSLILDIFNNRLRSSDLLQEWDDFLKENTAEVQAERLRSIYSGGAS